MNIKLLMATLSLSIMVSGCATGISASTSYGSANVGIGLNGHSSGAAIVGALIAGGIIGTILANEKSKSEQKVHSSSQISELESQNATKIVKVSAVDNQQASNTLQTGYQSASEMPSTDGNIPQPDYQGVLSSSNSTTEWYQLGKDGNCYLMSVTNGVSDIVSAVADAKCEK